MYRYTIVVSYLMQIRSAVMGHNHNCTKRRKVEIILMPFMFLILTKNVREIKPKTQNEIIFFIFTQLEKAIGFY